MSSEILRLSRSCTRHLSVPTEPKPPAPRRPTKKAAKPSYTGYHDAFPRSEGPPIPTQGSGASILAAQGRQITVVLDEGAFRAIWELAEATGASRWAARESMKSVGAILRGVTAFREAFKGATVGVQQEMFPPVELIPVGPETIEVEIIKVPNPDLRAAAKKVMKSPPAKAAVKKQVAARPIRRLGPAGGGTRPVAPQGSSPAAGRNS